VQIKSNHSGELLPETKFLIIIFFEQNCYTVSQDYYFFLMNGKFKRTGII